MRLAATTLKKDESPAIQATKTVAKVLIVAVLLLATIAVIYLAS
jgi:hypothetical protein